MLSNLLLVLLVLFALFIDAAAVGILFEQLQRPANVVTKIAYVYEKFLLSSTKAELEFEFKLKVDSLCKGNVKQHLLERTQSID